MSTPPTTAEPSVGRSRPARMRRRDDFPLPDGPTTAVTELARMRASIPLSASTRPDPVGKLLTRSVQSATASVCKTHHLARLHSVTETLYQSASDQRGRREDEA